MYACICRGIRESDLVRLAEARPLTSRQVIELFNLDATDCCGRCARRAGDIAAAANNAAAARGACHQCGRGPCPLGECAPDPYEAAPYEDAPYKDVPRRGGHHGGS